MNASWGFCGNAQDGFAAVGWVAKPCIEVTGRPDKIINKLVDAKPDLILNVAEGVSGVQREAYYPAIFRMMHLPFTGSSSFVLHVGLDKNLTEAILAKQGITVPHSQLINRENKELPDDFPFPAIIKP
jgi:D-alanine-D-alanine ligase-like ATP-grasp enzyme